MPTFRFPTKIATPRLRGIASVELQINIIVDSEFPSEETRGSRASWGGHSIVQQPGASNMSELTSISTRLVEGNIEFQITDNLSFDINLRLFENSIKNVTELNLSVLSLRVLLTSRDAGAVPTRLSGFQITQSGRLPTRLNGTLVIKFSADAVLTLANIGRDMLRFRETGQALAVNAQRIEAAERLIEQRRLASHIQTDRAALRALNSTRRGATAQAQAHRLRRRIASYLQQQSRDRRLLRTLLDQKATLGRGIRRLTARMGTRRDSLGRILKPMATRVIKNMFSELGQRLLTRILPVVNGLSLFKDVYDVTTGLINIAQGRAAIGFQEGAEEAQENPANSIEESMLGAEDSASEGPNISAEARGTEETGTEAPITDQERGTRAPEQEPTPRTPISPPSNPNPDNTQNPGPIDTTDTNEDLMQNFMDNYDNPNVNPHSTTSEQNIDELVNFVIRNQGDRRPHFVPKNPFPNEITDGAQFEGTLMVHYQGNFMAGNVTITITTVRRLSQHPDFPTSATYPSFMAVDVNRNLRAIPSDRMQFTMGRGVRPNRQ